MARKGRVKAGIAGLGRSGWNIHRRYFEQLNRKYQIVAVLDQDKACLKEAEDKFGCRTYTDYGKFLKDKETELVVVAMPNSLHARYSIDAMKAGKNVVCEKPMATRLKDADRMMACAKRTRRLLTIFQNRRYSPDFVAVRKVIESGVLGRIVHVRMAYHGFSRRWDWQTLKKYGGGTLNNTGPHPIDQALVLFGDRQPKVFCLRDKTLTLGDADDHVKVILHGKGAPTIEVEITAACAYRQDSWLVMGTQGGLSGSGAALHWKYFNPRRLPKRKLDRRPSTGRSYCRDKITFTEKTWDYAKYKGPQEEGYYLDLYDTLRKRKPLAVKPEQVRRQMWVLEQCRKQAPV